MKSNVRESKLTYFDARIYIGNKESKTGDEITLEKLLDVIKEFQNSFDMVPVRITSTTYLAGDYVEEGFEIGVTSFSVHEAAASKFSDALANHLLHTLKQSKVGVAYGHSGPYVGQYDGSLVFLEDLNAKNCCEK